MKNLKQLSLVFIFTIFGQSLPTHAVPVNFYGTLIVPPPCEINNKQDITVLFPDNMLTGKVDGLSYETKINLGLNCSSATSTMLKLQFSGVAASFDSSVVSTTKQNLGIEIRNDGKKLPINTWVNFNSNVPLTLTAIPVKAPGLLLDGGKFTAYTMLLVDYQ